MISIVLMSRNIRERQILHMAFEQHGFRVLISEPDYRSFVMLQQFIPDIILIDLPEMCTEHISFVKRVRGYKRTRMIPIVGYGNRIAPSLMRGIQESGVTGYIERPLKINNLLALIEKLLKPFNKTIEKKAQISDKEKDAALILSENVNPTAKIEAMSRHVAKLMAFPFTIATVLRITNDERSGAGHLAKAISADPVIAAHILKVSNSVFFASANRRIGSIKEAIIRIGFIETKKIVMGMSVMKLFGSTTTNLGFDRTDFWYHSLAAAIIAERVAKSFGDVNTEEAFLAGLLHDLGILLLDDFFPQIFNEVLELTVQKAGLFIENEMTRLKVTHLDLIADLFPKWKIPPEITDAISNQYSVIEKSNPPVKTEEKLALCIAMGNLLAKLIHCGRECDEFVTPLNNMFLESAKLFSGITAGFIEAVRSQVETFRSFLALESREYQCVCPEGINVKDIRIGVWNPERAVFIPPVIDMQSHGIRCETIPDDAGVDKLDNKYHAIFCWTTFPFDTEKLVKLTSLHQAPLDSKGAEKNGSKKAPVIVFCSDSSGASLPSGCIAMNNRLDLRLLEARLTELLLAESESKEMTKA